jgi:hypothetical protein
MRGLENVRLILIDVYYVFDYQKLLYYALLLISQNQNQLNYNFKNNKHPWVKKATLD